MFSLKGIVMRSILTFGAIFTAMSATAVIQPAHASDARSASASDSAIHSYVSAQKKKKASSRHYRPGPAGYPAYSSDPRSLYYLRPGVAPSFGYIGPPGYAGEYAWRRSLGQCVEDLGYGRWAACGSR